MLMATIPDSDLVEIREMDLTTEEGRESLKMFAKTIE
jgi:hypothetical protein